MVATSSSSSSCVTSSFQVPQKRIKDRQDFEIRFKQNNKTLKKRILEYLQTCDIPMKSTLYGSSSSTTGGPLPGFGLGSGLSSTDPSKCALSPSDLSVNRERKQDFRAPTDVEISNAIATGVGVNAVGAVAGVVVPTSRGPQGGLAAGNQNGQQQPRRQQRISDDNSTHDVVADRQREFADVGDGSGQARENEDYPLVTRIEKFTAILKQFMNLVDEIPLEPRTDMRFGNSTFRTWFAQVEEKCEQLVRERLLPVDKFGNAWQEFSCYLINSFGDKTRIDYGTGHELNFICCLYCLEKGYGYFTQAERGEFVLAAFTAYMTLMRKLQSHYVLEPAGSHGVWGLDDFHHVVYIFGASQLRKQASLFAAANNADDDMDMAGAGGSTNGRHNVRTNVNQINIAEPGGGGALAGSRGQQQAAGVGALTSISNQAGTALQLQQQQQQLLQPDMVLQAAQASQHHAYLFVAAVRNILDTKRGAPFHETSPQLNDILHTVPSWDRLYLGLIKMYVGEVLEKFPVIQHFYFGTTLPYE
ncbi:unnamed protein product [Amoebophrya sp. A120]|nr:unnamed protein product [Amoebophrya sp. A120]|eukprot:GSA120T00023926001.1